MRPDRTSRRAVSVRRALLPVAAVAIATLAGAEPAAAQATWTEVGALFAARCTACHSGAEPPADLRLDTLDGALAGSTNRPVLVAGDPDASELVLRIRGLSQPQMPLDGPPFLSADEIALVEAWVRAGLPAGRAAGLAAH